MVNIMSTLRDRGALVPSNLAQDMAVVCIATAAGSFVYVRLCNTRKVTNWKDTALLTSGVAILWYAARFLLFGTRWGVNSTFFLAEPWLGRLMPVWQWSNCTGLDPAACSLRGQYAQQQLQGLKMGTDAIELLPHRHFAPLVHYFPYYAERLPGTMMLHLAFITAAGVLWPLQIWHSFRAEDYRRHRIIGRLALLNMAGALASASVFTVQHLRSNSLAEKVAETLPVSGAGFGALIAVAGYNLVAGAAAAKRRDIATHQRCMVRMVGGAYGVFPVKHLFVVLASFLLPGHWAYAAAVWLSWPTGILLTEAALLRGLPSSDQQRDRTHANKTQ